MSLAIGSEDQMSSSIVNPLHSNYMTAIIVKLHLNLQTHT